MSIRSFPVAPPVAAPAANARRLEQVLKAGLSSTNASTVTVQSLPPADREYVFVVAKLTQSHSGSGPNSTTHRYVDLGRVATIEFDDATKRLISFTTDKTVDARTQVPAAIRKKKIDAEKAGRKPMGYNKALNAWLGSEASHVQAPLAFTLMEATSGDPFETNIHLRGKQAWILDYIYKTEFLFFHVPISTMSMLSSWRYPWGGMQTTQFDREEAEFLIKNAISYSTAMDKFEEMLEAVPIKKVRTGSAVVVHL
jgi:hypothetical protein